ncbi:cob(I)yrinic acid a,c-diamide adenosyltransferase [[Eubacterium] cellulosolvens]
MTKEFEKAGLIHVYTGNGKGKTTAALGLALRAAGHNMRICVIMFLKGKSKYGEKNTANQINNIEIYAYGEDDLIIGKPTRKDFEEAEEAFNHARRVITGKKYDIVILDELTHAINLGLIQLNDVMELIEKKPLELELIITGRNAPLELLNVADYITELNEKKHPYRKGIKARKGIEY